MISLWQYVRKAMFLAIATLSFHGNAIAQPKAVSELSAADMAQAEAAQSGDTEKLAASLHRDYLVHLPNGQIVDRERILQLAKGMAAVEKFERRQLKVIVAHDTGIVMGIDQLETPPSLALKGERSRHYTNIYKRVAKKWQLLARHFNFMP